MFLQYKSSNREPYSHGAQFCSAPFQSFFLQSSPWHCRRYSRLSFSPSLESMFLCKGQEASEAPTQVLFLNLQQSFQPLLPCPTPNIRRNCSSATAQRDSCLPRDLLAVLGGFHPLPPLMMFPRPRLSPHKTDIRIPIICIVIS